MIEASYLASIRKQLRAELVLVMVQLEQLCPGWWLTIGELSEELGTDRATLNRTIVKLERLGLLRRASISNSGGVWVWWVKRHEGDAPRAADEPAWVLRNGHRERCRVPISDRWDWARRNGIPRNTMRSFLAGHHMTLRDQWQVVSTPMDAVGGVAEPDRGCV